MPLTVSRFCPGPVIVKESPVAGSIVITEANVIVCGELKDESNTIVSDPAVVFELKTAARKLPGPLSLVLVTVKVAAAALIVAVSKISRGKRFPEMIVAGLFGCIEAGFIPA